MHRQDINGTALTCQRCSIDAQTLQRLHTNGAALSPPTDDFALYLNDITNFRPLIFFDSEEFEKYKTFCLLCI